MRPRTALIYGLLFFFVILLVKSVEDNQKLLNERFFIFGGSIKLSTALILALMLGFFVFISIIIALGIDKFLYTILEKLKEHTKRESEQRYLKGIDAIMQARPYEAIKHFKEAILLNPRSIPALIKMGDALRETGDIDGAIEWHKKALLEGSKNIPSLYALAIDYLKKENSEEAKRFLNEIISLQPKRALFALRLLRNIYIKEKNFFKAKEYQTKILKASVLKEEIREDDIFSYTIDYQIYCLFIKQKKMDEAILGFESLKRNYPQFYPTYLKISEALLLSSDEDSAIRNLKEGFHKTQSMPPLLMIEKIFLEKGEPEKAIKMYKSIIEEDKFSPIPKFLLSRLLIRMGFYGEAESYLNELQYSFPNFYLIEYYLAKINERKQEYMKACSHYSEMFRLLKPQDFVFICECGAKSNYYEDFCKNCLKSGLFRTDIENELKKERVIKDPAYYSY